MYELNIINGNTYYIECPAKIGVYKISENEIVLIDAGNDKEVAKKILKILEAREWKLKAIFITHSNADHIGGCEWLQKKTGCRIYAPDIEMIFSNYPILESSFLYGGYPMKGLRNKFLMAKPSNVEELIADVLPDGIEMVSLPGHFFQMVGFKTDDGVCFLADSLFGANILEKYHLTFVYDVAAYLNTLERVRQLDEKVYVPAHASVTGDIVDLVDANIKKVHEIIMLICHTIKEGKTFEKLLKAIFEHYSLVLDMNQYVLIGSTIKSYLSYLVDKGEVEIEIIDNEVIWRTVEVPSE